MNLREFGSSVSEHDYFGMFEHLLDAVTHQIGNMRDVVEDVVSIGPRQTSKMHVLIVNQQIVALANQPFDKLDDRTLAQIIGTGFEAEAEHSDTALTLTQHKIESALHVSIVAGQNRVQDRGFDIQGLRAVTQSTNVLRQTRPAKGEARF